MQVVAAEGEWMGAEWLCWAAEGASPASWLCAFTRLLSLNGLVLGLMLCCDAPGIPHFWTRVWQNDHFALGPGKLRSDFTMRSVPKGWGWCRHIARPQVPLQLNLPAPLPANTHPPTKWLPCCRESVDTGALVSILQPPTDWDEQSKIMQGFLTSMLWTLWTS